MWRASASADGKEITPEDLRKVRVDWHVGLQVDRQVLDESVLLLRSPQWEGCLSRAAGGGRMRRWLGVQHLLHIAPVYSHPLPLVILSAGAGQAGQQAVHAGRHSDFP